MAICSVLLLSFVRRSVSKACLYCMAASWLGGGVSQPSDLILYDKETAQDSSQLK